MGVFKPFAGRSHRDYVARLHQCGHLPESEDRMLPRHHRLRRGAPIAAALILTLTLALPGTATAATSTGTGPSTNTDPYVLPVADGVHISSLLTVGDAAGNGYQMVGIPDGLGMIRQGANLVLY